MTKDFTKAQASRWVQQEIVKHTTRDSIVTRIKSEEFMIRNGDPRLVNSMAAHKELLIRLKEIV